MEFAPKRGSLAGLFLLAACLPGLAADGWQKLKPATPQKTIPKGKTLIRSVSPDRSFVLLLRDEGEKGDFFWRSVYVQQQGAYTRLTACNELRKARWGKKPTTVRFETDTATGPSVMERCEWVYTPSTKTLRKRLLRKLRVEGAG